MTPKFRDRSNPIGRGAMYTGRSLIVREGGLYTRENAGMSSERMVRNHSVESLRFPGEGLSSQGKSGTKVRPKGVADDKRVDIPVPPKYDKESKQGRRRIVEARGWKSVSKSLGL